MKKSKSETWFKKVRGSYLPNNVVGMVVYVAYVTYLISLVVGWFLQDYQGWTLITQVIPLSAAAAVLVQYIASKHVE